MAFLERAAIPAILCPRVVVAKLLLPPAMRLFDRRHQRIQS